MNPITRIREQLRLTRYELATLLDVSYDILAKTERGIIMKPGAILDGLQHLGYDRQQLQSQYQAYRKKRQEQIRQKLNDS